MTLLGASAALLVATLVAGCGDGGENADKSSGTMLATDGSVVSRNPPPR